MTNPRPAHKTFSELCRDVGKQAVYIRNLQAAMGLHMPSDHQGYGPAYEEFLRTVIALRTFGVAQQDVVELFHTEKKLLVLLKIDTLSGSPTWYLDQCGRRQGAECLLLTGHPVHVLVAEGELQPSLDFSERAPELFDGREMGEDVRRVLESCRRKTARIMERVQSEVLSVKHAVAWAAVAKKRFPKVMRRGHNDS